MNKINTNWSTPKTNMFAGINDLRKAKAYGQNAVLIRMNNEDCDHPIKIKHSDTDFRNYKLSTTYMRSRNEILNDKHMSEFDKHLTLNYINYYGTKDAVDTYYSTGVLTMDNVKGIGTSHLVKVEDLISILFKNNQKERAEMYLEQYINNVIDEKDHESDTKKYWYSFFEPKTNHQLTPKKFKYKLWVIQLLKTNEPKPNNSKSFNTIIKIINLLSYPLMYIPKKSILQMPDYKLITFRLGSISNGYKIEFQIPKKFKIKP